MNRDELKHFGIKGMQWGVRRKRGANGRVDSTDSTNVRALKKNKLKTLSNDELAKINKRLQLEQTYKQLAAKDKSHGQQFVERVLSNAASQLATQFVNSAVNGFIAGVKDKS